MRASHRICSIGLAHSSDGEGRRPIERLPLTTIIPRAWIGFSKAPWRCVGLTALMLIALTGFGVIARDLQQSGSWWLSTLGDGLLLVSIPAALVPLVALLHLADQMLPAGSTAAADRPTPETRPLSWLLKQTAALVLLEGVILIGAVTMLLIMGALLVRHSGMLANSVLILGGLMLTVWCLGQSLALPLLVHHRHRPLAAMEHSRRLVQANRLKVLALLGLILGVNLIGLMGACLGLLLSIPISAMLLMASCRTQTPWDRDSRWNMLPT